MLTANEINKVFGDKNQKAFVVDAKDIADNKFDLSINQYKEVVYEEERYEDPKKILKKFKVLENEILQDLDELEKMFREVTGIRKLCHYIREHAESVTDITVSKPPKLTQNN